MADLEITCIRPKSSSHQHIIGVSAGGGTIVVPQVVREIESETNTFFVIGGGKKIPLRALRLLQAKAEDFE